MVLVSEPAWASVVEQLQARLAANQFELWIRPLRSSGVEGKTFHVLAPNDFHFDYVKRNFLEAILAAVESVAAGYRFNMAVGAPVEAAAAAVTVTPAAEAIPVSEREMPDRPKLHPLLNGQYTFDSFVVGTSNQVAHASAQSVSENLGRAFNPLFLAGGAGLGKTHLLHAIGHSVHQADPKKRIYCMPAERFMNEYVSSIQRGKSIEFKEKYRQGCDLLLIDDVHTMAGKEGTQEEFFHIFNALYDNGRQIVLTSDKYPKDMPGLEQRLRSRFEWGLIADIQPPEMETRVAIIRKKAEFYHMALPDEVAIFLATLQTTSVRDLEGYLTRLRAFSNFENRPITLEFAHKTLANLMGEPKVVNTEDIMKKVADFFSVRVLDIKSSSRKASLTEPRHVAMYLSRELTDLSFPEIGQRFGGKNHATVINACDNVRKKMAIDAHFSAIVSQLKKTLS